MPTPDADVVRLSSTADLISMVPQLLGFRPTESVVVICLHGEHRRVGLAMRFNLVDAADPVGFAAVVTERLDIEAADAAFVIVFSTSVPGPGAPAEHAPRFSVLSRALFDGAGDLVADVVITDGDRWWSTHCEDSCCGGSAGVAIDAATPGALAVAAAYALAGQAVLPDRDAVVRSIAPALSTRGATATRRRILARAASCSGVSRGERRVAMRELLARLMSRLTDPRGAITATEVAEFAALCEDVVVRDEVLVHAVDAVSRAALLPVLRELARRVPAPLDAPICAMLAWAAYAQGDGVLANIAVERSLATDPDYSLAQLIADALYRQIPPRMLEEVMRGAARDLECARDVDRLDGGG